MNPEMPKRPRVPLVPLLIGIAAVLVVCVGAVVVLTVLAPWRSGSGQLHARVVTCDIQEHAVPFPNEAGFAQVTIEVNNVTAKDTVYVVGVAVKTTAGAEVGKAEHRIGVPARQVRTQTWRVTLTKPGGRKCEVAKMFEDSR